MIDKTTLPEMYHELMKAPSIVLDHCAVCGKFPANNQHHLVRRNAGELYKEGYKLKKPTITLCGSGTTGCHGLAHQNRLHFRWVDCEAVPGGFGNFRRMNSGSGGHLEYLLTADPVSYQTALSLDGWRRIGGVYDDVIN